ncbi:tRNA pseudouridine synthase B [Marmoricola endophyticus]|uniref:tRNA pseudouridine synthase B n=1 Tax=Marmoricola endophyticus TaxID=2040280 RepID=A0A917BEP5_9ACTN|nr:tRNA pseudouridine(55) synthase TruB [Marmoricola endophyticus]GGF38483.1 tRNA pseudouridine synthase B [Marmoricola endophyticus]
MSEPAPGLAVVDKPPGMTSHDVVSRVRRLAGTRKVGHAGTLDPMATGVLVLGVGRATRLLGHLTLTEKSYDATVRLGVATTTDDAEGEVVSTRPAGGLDEDGVRAALAEQVGDRDQVPSAVSAVKVDGRRAYARVRDGEQVVLEPRRVRIEAIGVHDVRRAGESLDLDVSVRCSSGTYVRAIARDLGERLGVGGHLTALRRTRVGPFDLDVARTLEQLAEQWRPVPIADAARLAFPHLAVPADVAARVRSGAKVPLELPSREGPVALIDPDGDFLALYEQRGDVAAAVAVFC